jgi:hypothetical protein
MKTSPYGLNSKTAKTSGGYLKELEFQNSEYELHQVGPKNSGSQNFSFLALKAEPVGEVHILRTATATAPDRRKNFSLKSCFLAIKSPETWKSAIKKINFSHHETNFSLIFHWQVKNTSNPSKNPITSFPSLKKNL